MSGAGKCGISVALALGRHVGKSQGLQDSLSSPCVCSDLLQAMPDAVIWTQVTMCCVTQSQDHSWNPRGSMDMALVDHQTRAFSGMASLSLTIHRINVSVEFPAHTLRFLSYLIIHLSSFAFTPYDFLFYTLSLSTDMDTHTHPPTPTHTLVCLQRRHKYHVLVLWE